MPGRWRDHEEHELTPASLDALFNNEIPCIRVKGFATPWMRSGSTRNAGRSGRT